MNPNPQPGYAMKTIAPFVAHNLKLARQAAQAEDSACRAATQAKAGHTLEEEVSALEAREENLRAYEARLRELQAEIDLRTPPSRVSRPPFRRPGTQAPFEGVAEMQADWEKLHRARELLEAEVAHLRGDRLALADEAAALKRREEVVALREARVAERERLVAMATPVRPVVKEPVPAPASSPSPFSTVGRLTQAPFAFARSVFKTSAGNSSD